jgi:hypothetical protein
MLDFPNSPATNDAFQFWTWDGFKWTVMPSSLLGNNVPIVFPFTGKPPAGLMVNVPVSIPLAVPAGLSGSTVYANTPASAGAVFTFNRIRSGTATPLGTVTITPTSHTSCTLAGAGGSLAIGDDLQIVTPASPDASLADLGVTLLTTRV